MRYPLNRLRKIFLFSGRKWNIEPQQITIDLFDPKFRKWFTGAEAPPRDIVFLID